MNAATPTAEVLNDAGLKLMMSSIRRLIANELNAVVFKGWERKKGNGKAGQCDNVSQLHTWLKNIRAERSKREQALKDQQHAS